MASMWKSHLAIAGLLVLGIHGKPHKVSKRTTPVISEDFDEQENAQLNEAFGDAINLAWYAAGAVPFSLDVFKKYFREEDKDDVIGVYQQISWYSSNVPEAGSVGNALLGDVQFVEDFTNDDYIEEACGDPDDEDDPRGDTLMATRYEETDNPLIVVCEPAFEVPGQHNDYGKLEHVTCDRVREKNDHLNWRMETLGATILHEYTHWAKLVGPAIGRATTDRDNGGYGPFYARELLKNNPEATKYNAESYVWYATEQLWSYVCGYEIQDPDITDNSEDLDAAFGPLEGPFGTILGGS